MYKHILLYSYGYSIHTLIKVFEFGDQVDDCDIETTIRILNL